MEFARVAVFPTFFAVSRQHNHASSFDEERGR